MNAWRQLLMQAVLRHRAGGTMWITWALLGTAMLPLAAIVPGWASRQAGAGASGVALSIALVMWWGLYLQTAMRLNAPALACLVPAMHRRLLALTAVLWLAASVPPAILFGAATGHYGHALWLCAAALQYVALCCRYPWLGFLASFAWLATRLPWYPGGALEALFAANELVVTPLALLVLAGPGFVVLRLLFPRGGDAHYRVAACLERQASNGRGGRAGRAGMASGLFRLLDTLYYRRLAVPGHAATRLLDALGPRAHWSRPVAIVAVLAVAALGWRGFTSPEPMRPFIPLLLVAMLLAVVTHVDGLLSAVKNTGAEQAILRLVPAAPPVRGLNRQLALALLGRFGIVWCAYLAASGAVVLATTGSWRAWLCCMVAALAFAPLLLRDHARHPGWKTAQFAAGVLMLVMAPLAGMADYGAIPLPAVIGGCAVLLAGTVIALVLRWRSALGAAPAFPAGRLAA